MARKHVKSPGAHKSHQHIQLRGKLLALEQLLHLIGEAGILIGRRSLLTHEHTNNTIKIVSSRPNLSLSLSFISRSLQPGIQKLQKELQQKRRAHEPWRNRQTLWMYVPCKWTNADDARARAHREHERKGEGDRRGRRARAQKREKNDGAPQRETQSSMKLFRLWTPNCSLHGWELLLVDASRPFIVPNYCLLRGWRNTHFFVDEDTLSGDAFHLFIVVSLPPPCTYSSYYEL